MEQTNQELARPELGETERPRRPWIGRVFYYVWLISVLAGVGFGTGHADTASTALEKGPRFTVGSYNLENYLDIPKGTRRVKTEASKAQVRKTLIKLNADILALQEVGSYEAFQELRQSLRREGLDYPHHEFVRGWDTNIFLGVLSRYEIVARRPHTNTSFMLNGRRLHVSRGFAEVDVRLNPSYQITLLTAHLKSRRSSYEANEADWREQEALRLREVVDTRLALNPRLNLVVVGDLNDTPDSKPIRLLVGRGKTSLVDGRPAERNGDDYQATEDRVPTRRVGWTHYYAKEDSYSRIDYILMSRGLAAEWERAGTYVLAIPNWGLASDHRPVVAEFVARER
jgi:endonuclease/exonuclease/phosphatase family metal-dependent hydrolase